MLNIRSLSPRLHRILSGVVSRAMDEGVSGRLSESFRETERSGLMLASGVRVGALAAMTLAFLVTQSFTGSGAVVLYAMAAGLGLVGLLQLEALRRWPEFSWTKYVFVVFDCVFLTGFLLFRHALSEGALIFYIPFLVQSAFSYSPRFILWTGGWITAGWTTVVVAAALAPETQFVLPADAQGWDAYGNPSYLPLIKVTYDFVCFGAVLAGLAVAVWRSRELVKAAAVSEKARANLARHFSPRVLDELSSREQPFGAVRRQSAAILFADIRGFTTRCETMEPEEAIAFLRDFHARMEDVIFRHGGTLDKILGDGLLAVFGIPDRGTGDAGDALACAYDMAENVRRWNEEREAQGLFPVHIGPVMTGDVGSERLMTFTVVGDTVNVASRLQSLSKEIGTILVASEALVDAVREELKHDAQLVDELTRIGPRQLRGRESETVVYALQLDAGSTTA
jgi:adenylate cyclase